ncbi:hypothetical protein FYA67_10090 [Bordetella holmesii]|nr:hypothetical protein H558_16130 [Bordetella holmesii H558]AOB35782.1 hypothetical protein BBB42_09880 [Bordetella holmesii]AUL19752.1 hypothetical protein BTL46_09930 [Bordetella holmesii]AUL23092.1 hypothetical protein BTL48_09995 [Bordetella holmesii]AUL26405.1 hypothetical protein BTL49_10010 [Bordetella holmesii]
MTVVLARFVYGVAMAWIALAIMLALALVCLRVVRRTVRSFETERQQDLASGLVVFVAVTVALAACYACGHVLHAWMGKSALVGGQPQWLAGNSHLSAAALMGATVALGLAAAAPGLWRRLQTPRADRPVPQEGRAKPEKKASPQRSTKAAVKQRPRPRRIAALGWAALFVILLGAILLAFAYIVAPLDPAPLAAGADAKMIARANVQAEHILRARPIYYAAAGLLGAGSLIVFGWLISHRWRGA